jgi:hypothetical protein
LGCRETSIDSQSSIKKNAMQSVQSQHRVSKLSLSKRKREQLQSNSFKSSSDVANDANEGKVNQK